MANLLDDYLPGNDKPRQPGVGGPVYRDLDKARLAAQQAGLKFREDQATKANDFRERSLDLDEERYRYTVSVDEVKRNDEAMTRAQSAAALRELATLNGTEADFDTKVSGVLEKNPHAALDGNVNRLIQDRMNIRQRFQAINEAKDLQAKAEAEAAASGLKPKVTTIVDGKKQVTYAPAVTAKDKADELLSGGVLKDADYDAIMAEPDEEKRMRRLRSAEGGHKSELAAAKQEAANFRAAMSKLQAKLRAVDRTDLKATQPILDEINALQLGTPDAPQEDALNSKARELGLK